jgi:prevent-host-death family protein
MNMPRSKKTLTVGAREANQRFSYFLRAAEDGNEVIITRNGKEVARLVSKPKPLEDKDRLRLVAKVMKATLKGLPIKQGNRRFTRDEMHER